MNIKFYFLKLIWMSSVMNGAISGSLATEYHYDNYALDMGKWNIPSSYIFDIKSSTLMDPTNGLFKLNLCEKNDGFSCYICPVFYFAIQNKETKIGSKWDYGGKKYAVLDEANIVIFGVKHNVLRIESIASNSMRFIYFYSRKAGLVGFSLVSKSSDATETYWLREATGIAATIE